MGPDIAIPVAEKSGLIDDIGGWIVQRACLDLKRLQRSPKASTLGISVNLSARQLRAPLFVPTVAAMLNHTATDPSLLTLEITENVLVHDIEGIVFVVEGLRRLGVQVALDDFGTGYSSLTQMQQVPFDVVKIDRSIISGLNHTQSNQVLVQAAVAMAHGLGMAIVAEGIETPAERELAISLGCDRLQGYFFAHPTSVEGLGALLELK
jgi:EAL domain-containing protein (putative c-di-GMP-specific phosphodiesterase class I)